MLTLLKAFSNLLHALKLLLPALFPSWNFFDVIAPSPRIQFTLRNKEDDLPHEWHEFRPRPIHVSFIQMLKRMFWNPKWNESLYMLSCAERLIEKHTPHSEDEILQRIIKEIKNTHSNDILVKSTHLQFRLIVIHRKNDQLHEELVYLSRIQPLSIRDVL